MGALALFSLAFPLSFLFVVERRRCFVLLAHEGFVSVSLSLGLEIRHVSFYCLTGLRQEVIGQIAEPAPVLIVLHALDMVSAQFRSLY